MLLEVFGESLEVLIVGLDVVDMCTVPVKTSAHRSCDISPRYSLVLVLLQDLVSIVLNATNHVRDEFRGLALKEPGECNNALCDSAEVVEERGRTV